MTPDDITRLTRLGSATVAFFRGYRSPPDDCDDVRPGADCDGPDANPTQAPDPDPVYRLYGQAPQGVLPNGDAIPCDFGDQNGDP